MRRRRRQGRPGSVNSTRNARPGTRGLGESRAFSDDPAGPVSYICCMDSILPVLLGAAMLATLGVLFAGVIAFAFNSKTNAKYATRLMTARVVCQAVAVALFAAMVLLQIV